MSGDAKELARLCNTILSRTLAGEKDSTFYRDVDEAISLKDACRRRGLPARCGCQQLTSPSRRWRVGHDQVAKGIIKRAVKEGKVGELPDRLREYGKERGLLDV